MAREVIYESRFRRRLARLKSRYGDRLEPHSSVGPTAGDAEIWRELQAALTPSCPFASVSLAQGGYGGQRYWGAHQNLYRAIGNGREKALEHALTFELLDFDRVRRYCDVAAASSPIEPAVKADRPTVEFWKQDCIFKTDPERRIIGGFAQDLAGVQAGFFDAMTLHCAFEHFARDSDGQLVAEVDRVLSDRGACLIIPLYIDLVHKLYFDPGVTPVESTPDEEGALLCPTHDYRQDHGRYYSPRALLERVISKVPQTLQATVVRFTDREALGPEIYLRFALVLHRRSGSVFRLGQVS